MKVRVRESQFVFFEILPVNSTLGFEVDIAADELKWMRITMTDFWKVHRRLSDLYDVKAAADEDK